MQNTHKKTCLYFVLYGLNDCCKAPSHPTTFPPSSSISLSQSRLQVGPGVRFTDDTQKQDSPMHFVKINGSLSLSSEILNLLYICWNIQNNTRIRCQRSVDLLEGEVKAKQNAVVD